MRRIRFVALPLLSLMVIGAAAAALRASDRVSVYARIDKVVLGPESASSQTIQVFGVFSLAKANNPNDYEPVQRGYMYYTLTPGKEELSKREWNDLKSVAELSELAEDAGRQLGSASLSQSGTVGRQRRERESTAIGHLDARLRKVTIRLTDELLEGWQAFRRRSGRD